MAPTLSDYWAPHAAPAQTPRHLFVLSLSPGAQSINPSGLVEIRIENRNPTRVAARIHEPAGARFPLLVFDLSQPLIRLPVAVFLLGFFFWIFSCVYFFFVVVSFQDRAASAISRRLVGAFPRRFEFSIFTRVLLAGV